MTDDFAPDMVGALGSTDTERLTAMVAINIGLRMDIERLTAEVRELNREVCLHTCTVRACHFDGICERWAPSEETT